MTPDQHPRPSEAVRVWLDDGITGCHPHVAIPVDPDSLAALRRYVGLLFFAVEQQDITASEATDAVLAEILGDVEKETGA